MSSRSRRRQSDRALTAGRSDPASSRKGTAASSAPVRGQVAHAQANTSVEPPSSADTHAALTGATSEELAALVVSHRFDPGPPGGPPYQATLRLSGRRIGLAGPATARDAFSMTQLITGVVPGSGPMSTTSWIY